MFTVIFYDCGINSAPSRRQYTTASAAHRASRKHRAKGIVSWVVGAGQAGKY